MIRLKLRLIFIVLSLLLLSCFGFGLIPVSFWYVDEKSGNKYVTIETKNSKSDICISFPEQELNIKGNNFFTYGVGPSAINRNNQAVNVCFDSLYLLISKKKTPAKICFWYKSEPFPSLSSSYVDVTDTCIYFPNDYQDQIDKCKLPDNILLFINTPHVFKSKASIIGSMRIYSDGKLIDKKDINIKLKKRSYKPFLILM